MDVIQVCSVGVDSRDPEMVVVLPTLAAEQQRLLRVIPVIDVTVPMRGVLESLVIIDGIFLKVVEGRVESDERHDLPIAGYQTEDGLIFFLVP